MQPIRSISLALCILLFCACDPGGDPPVAEVEQGVLSAGEEVGWIYFDGGAVVGARSYNSTGGALLVDHPGLGLYTARIAGLTLAGGNAAVTSVGTGSQRCKVETWNWTTTPSTEVRIFIRCHTAGGALTDSPFVVSYASFVGGPTFSSKGAYVVMDQPTGGALNTGYMWGDSVTVSHDGVGAYSLSFTGHTMSDGNVQVTAVGGGNEHCKVSALGVSLVRVRCFAGGGGPANTRFALRYTRGSIGSALSIHDTIDGSGAYVYSDKATSSTQCYTPTAAYQFDLVQGSPAWSCLVSTPDTVCRRCSALSCLSWLPGIYDARLPHLAEWIEAAVPVVTAFGTDNTFCKIAGWANNGSDTVVTVTCWNPAGTAVDSQFNLLFLSNEFVIC